MTITKNEATKLWGQLRNALLNLEGLLKEIVEKRAWEPLGYKSFHDAWAKELDGVALSPHMRSAVVYAMFNAGATADDVSASVKGVGPVKARAYEEAFDKELDVELADKFVSAKASLSAKAKPGDTFVHAHVRRRPRFSGRITGEGFSEKQIAEWKRLAEERDLDWKELIREVLETGLNEQLGVG